MATEGQKQGQIKSCQQVSNVERDKELKDILEELNWMMLKIW
jgi:hypothetical protein